MPDDPHLPYAFDLLWDLKSLSQLRESLLQGWHSKKDEEDIREMMIHYNITIDGLERMDNPGSTG